VERTVTRVAGILAVACVGFLADAVIAVTQLADFSAASAALAALGNPWVDKVWFSLVYTTVVGAAGAVFLGLVAAGIHRRRRPSRGAALVGSAALGVTAILGLALDATSGVATPEQDLIDAVIAPWYSPTHSALVGLALIGAAVAAVTLFRISSIDFYD
jgi:hypothetical protein